MNTIFETVAKILHTKKDCVAITGAGISAESGISTFREKDGLWSKYDPYIYASIDFFRKDPSKYWEVRGDFMRNYDCYRPNNGHLALAELEHMGIVRHVITQNIDGLHHKAGSKNVVEVHGSIRESYCMICNKKFIAPDLPEGTPPYCHCGGVIKPSTVLFGEPLPMKALMIAQHELLVCKSLLLIGTSAVVQPVASFPYLAKEHGAVLIEVNIEKSFPDADFYIEEKAGIAMPGIVDAIKKLPES